MMNVSAITNRSFDGSCPWEKGMYGWRTREGDSELQLHVYSCTFKMCLNCFNSLFKRRKEKYKIKLHNSLFYVII